MELCVSGGIQAWDRIMGLILMVLKGTKSRKWGILRKGKGGKLRRGGVVNWKWKERIKCEITRHVNIKHYHWQIQHHKRKGWFQNSKMTFENLHLQPWYFISSVPHYFFKEYSKIKESHGRIWNWNHFTHHIQHK